MRLKQTHNVIDETALLRHAQALRAEYLAGARARLAARLRHAIANFRMRRAGPRGAGFQH